MGNMLVAFRRFFDDGMHSLGGGGRRGAFRSTLYPEKHYLWFN